MFNTKTLFEIVYYKISCYYNKYVNQILLIPLSKLSQQMRNQSKKISFVFISLI